MKRIMTWAIGALLVVTLAPVLQARVSAGGSPSPAAVSPEQTVLIGLGQREVSQGSQLAYTPKYLDITVGDTVAFRQIDMLEPHTVTFGPAAMLKDLSRKDQFMPVSQKAGPPTMAFNPKVAFPTPGKTYDGTGYANSGILPPGNTGKTWTLTFTTPGTYRYICLIHGDAMAGYVIVHPAPPAGPMHIVQAGDGMQAGNDRANTTTNDAFYPYALTIHVGDTVQWIGGFHTISFGPEALITQLQKSLIMPMPQTSGPPLLVFNPKIMWASGGSTYNGTGYVNSGVLPLNMPLTSKAPPSFKLTFTKAGTYKYYCLVHPGMDGTVTVVP